MIPSDVTRERVWLADGAASVHMPLGLLWIDLAAGDLKVTDSFTWADRSYLLLSKVETGTRAPAVPLATLESVLVGGGLKSAATEHRCSASTVVARAKDVFSFMGLPCSLSRAPALLVMAACALYSSSLTLLVRRTAWREGLRSFIVVSLPRPDLAAAGRLTRGEQEVVRLLVEGLSRIEIAQSRGTSVRTVANQLSSAFRKLRVSGRLDLIRRLVVLSSSPARQSA